VSATVLGEPAALFARVPVVDLVLLVVVVGAALSILRGLRGRRRELTRLTPLILAVVGGTTAVWARMHGALTTLGSQMGVTAVVVTLLVVHLALDHRRGSGPAEGAHPEGPSPLRPPWRTCLVVALFLTGALLTWRLATFASSTLVWESPVTEGFGQSFHGDVGPARYAARALVWNDGLVSNGQETPLYGAPTYTLMRWGGFSTLSLRVFATFAAVLLVAALWAFVHRHFGPEAGAVAALVGALNTYVVFYGKYGTSLAATLLLCVVAALATGRLVRAEAPAWWIGPIAGLALFLATLHYSPGRLVVLVLVLSLVPSLVVAFRRRLWRSLAAFAGLGVVISGVVVAQFALGGQRFFLHARGEQLFTMLKQPDYIRDYLVREVPAFDAFKAWAVRIGLLTGGPNAAQRNPERQLTLDRVSNADRFEVAFKVVAVTVPQLNRFLSPFELIECSDQRIFDDPPPIKPYFAPFAVFTLLGAALSLRRFREWRHAVLLAWFGVGVAPVLLTNRLDAHRIVVSVVPLIVWTALGVVEAGGAIGRLGVSRRVRAGLGWALAALLLVGTGSVVLRQEVDGGEQHRVLAAARGVPGPVVVGALIDHRQRAWIELGLLERTRRDRGAEGHMLDAELREDLAHPEESWPNDLLDRVQSVCANSTLILAPEDAYRTAVDRLRSRGLQARELREGELSMWLIPRQTIGAAPPIAPASTLK
jgi:4-amino-4-deoxy-L-arabinose transferase-like glycosyltransferase